MCIKYSSYPIAANCRWCLVMRHATLTINATKLAVRSSDNTMTMASDESEFIKLMSFCSWQLADLFAARFAVNISKNNWSKSLDVRPHRRRTRTVRSYSPGSANIHPQYSTPVHPIGNWIPSQKWFFLLSKHKTTSLIAKCDNLTSCHQTAYNTKSSLLVCVSHIQVTYNCKSESRCSLQVQLGLY